MTKITVVGEGDDSWVLSFPLASGRRLGEMSGPDALSLSFHLSAFGLH